MKWKWKQWWKEYKEEWQQAPKRTAIIHIFVLAVLAQFVYGTLVEVGVM